MIKIIDLSKKEIFAKFIDPGKVYPSYVEFAETAGYPQAISRNGLFFSNFTRYNIHETVKILARGYDNDNVGSKWGYKYNKGPIYVVQLHDVVFLVGEEGLSFE